MCRIRGIACLFSEKRRRGPKRKAPPHSEPLREDDPEELMLVCDGRIRSDHGSVCMVAGLSTCDKGRQVIFPVGQHQVCGLPPARGVYLSPSGATGLVGLVENQNLNAYIRGWGTSIVLVQENDLRGAMIHVLSGGMLGPDVFEDRACRTDRDNWDVLGLREQNEGQAKLLSAIGCLWSCIGMGALVNGMSLEVAQPYVDKAEKALRGCFGHVSEDVLKAYLGMAYLGVFMDDFPSFYRYVSCARNVGDALGKKISGETKFILKIFQALENFIVISGDDGNPSHMEMEQEPQQTMMTQSTASIQPMRPPSAHLTLTSVVPSPLDQKQERGW
ncbi:unnamed protein product [Choristocarpus tenellus]